MYFTDILSGRPALESVKYINGLPVPRQPQDLAPPGVTQDLRDAPGAPDVTRPAVQMEDRDEEFYNPASFLPNLDDEADCDHQNIYKPSWSEKIGPGELPWRVFCA